MVKSLLYKILPYIVFTFISLAVSAADTMTGIMHPMFRSLQIKVNGDDQLPPVIVLDSDDHIEIAFDELADERRYLRYRLMHCDALWNPSRLVEQEFLDGFNIGDIEDFRFSMATATHYIHYSITLPNSQMRPIISGNYLLQVFPEENPDDILLQCRFMVSEQSAIVSAETTPRTDIDFQDSHQQLSLMVNTRHSGISDPFNRLMVTIQQNYRPDTETVLPHPSRVNGTNAYYEHLPEMIFKAGNEYRRFETVSTSFPTMGVEEISFSEPYYHMALYPDRPRSEMQYEFDKTQQGRFRIHEYNSPDPDVEADYAVVHFSLEMPKLVGSDVYIDGDLVNRRLDASSVMNYNNASGMYEKALLLKQGAYNYQYLTMPRGSTKAESTTIEGDKYETRNEYLVKVYNRDPMTRYDRLISVARVFSSPD